MQFLWNVVETIFILMGIPIALLGIAVSPTCMLPETRWIAVTAFRALMFIDRKVEWTRRKRLHVSPF